MILASRIAWDRCDHIAHPFILVSRSGASVSVCYCKRAR
jgi:hypothetical protein